MLRFLKNLVVIALILVFTLFFSINSSLIEVNIFPEEFLVRSTVLQIPLFVIMIIFCIIGFFVGVALEYLRAHKHRRLVREKSFEIKKLMKEVKELRKKTTSETGEILRLLK